MPITKVDGTQQLDDDRSAYINWARWGDDGVVVLDGDFTREELQQIVALMDGAAEEIKGGD